MNSPVKQNHPFESLLEQVRADYPSVTFQIDSLFCWSKDTGTIYYNPKDPDPSWSLLHELGHMQCNHSSYRLDNALIAMEMEAWETAGVIAEHYGCAIDPEHIQDCLDSYRTWQHTRSRCPTCAQTGVQTQSEQYHCINCGNDWLVSSERFCRTYRRQSK